MKEKIFNIIEEQRNNLIKDIVDLIDIKSVKEEATLDAPFGDGIKEALLLFLEKAKMMGFKTQNVDNYMGFVEYGEGEEVAVLTHLDVVPEGEGWETPAFKGVTKDGKVFGRGAVDNKGPAVSSLYALYALKEAGFSPSKKIKLLLGTDEESGWKCADYYFSKYSMPYCGFSPDAEFPIVYSEKGILTFSLKGKAYFDPPIKELSISGGDKANVVPSFTQVIIKGDKVFLKELKEKIEHIDKELFEIKSNIENDQLKIEVFGKPAHAAIPQKGKNSIGKMLVLLKEIEIIKEENNIFKLLVEKIGLDYTGKNFNLDLEDEISKHLTLNLGIIKKNSDLIEAIINIRYPITFKKEDILARIEKEIKGYGIFLEVLGYKAPHFVSPESFIVKTLKKVYEEVTEDTAELKSIGGGTYARAIPNCVAFGPVFPFKKEMAHLANEYIEIEDLIKATKIYALALLELSK